MPVDDLIIPGDVWIYFDDPNYYEEDEITESIIAEDHSWGLFWQELGLKLIVALGVIAVVAAILLGLVAT